MDKPMETSQAINKLLKAIKQNFKWLFDEKAFRVTQCFTDPINETQGRVSISNGIIEICFVTDRDHVYLEFSPTLGWKSDEGVTLDLIYSYLYNEVMDITELNETTVNFVKSSYDQIEQIFKSTDLTEVKKEFQKLKRLRAKRLFG